MKAVAVSGMVGVIISLTAMSCNKSREITSDKTREITTIDETPVKLNPTSADMFSPPSAQVPQAPEEHNHGEQASSATTGEFTYTAGESWTKLPAKQFREVNYQLPEGGEIYVSVSGGGVLPNLGRWFRQFGQEPIDAAGLEKLEKVQLMGSEAYVVETSGTFNAGFGKPARENTTLLGAITEVGGKIVTVKMIANPEVVESQRAAFKTFCETLKRQ